MDYLTTMGYMMQYGVDSGALIFREKLNAGALNSSVSKTNFGLFSHPDRRIKFCALQLVPRQKAQKDNRDALEQLISSTILA
jgi:hypothetical protein